MNTGPKAASAFNQGNQSKVEHNGSHPALFFLVQEVSKLTSPTSNANQPSKLLNEALMESHKDGVDDSFQASCSSCQHSFSCAVTYGHVKDVRDDGYGAGTLEERHCKSSSPWKALSLINFHCERLLHQRDAEGLGCSTATLPSAAPDVAEEVEHTSRPFLHLCEKEEIPARLGSVDDVRGSFAAGGGRAQLKTSEKTDSVNVEFQQDYKTSSLQEAEFSVGQLKWNQDVLRVSLSENALLKDACLNAELTFNSNDKACKDASKPALTLDYNANIRLSSQPSCNSQLPPPSTILSSLIFPNAESSPSEKDTCPPVTQLESSSHNASPAISEPKLCAVETDRPPARQRRTKTPRKQPHPSRSADIQDPDFQGVTFRMDTELDDTKKQCRLLITSKYSKELRKSVRKPRPRTRMLQKSLKTSSSDEESDLTANVLKGKVCASCCTRKTPMWRDAEDGTPLCNACGIRYKKYRVRCVNCWHIPRKEGNSNSRCLKCGNFVRLTSAQRKHTT